MANLSWQRQAQLKTFYCLLKDIQPGEKNPSVVSVNNDIHGGAAPLKSGGRLPDNFKRLRVALGFQAQPAELPVQRGHHLTALLSPINSHF